MLSHPLFFLSHQSDLFGISFLALGRTRFGNTCVVPHRGMTIYLAQLPCNANKNLEVRGILRIGFHVHVAFLHESEKPEDGTQCSPFLYERK